MLTACCISAALAFAQTDSGDASARYAAAGQQALAAGRYSDAEQAYERLRELDPGIAEVHAQLGVIYFQERRFDKAVLCLQQALKLKPMLPKTDTLLAMSLSELGRYKEALPGLEKGFQRSTNAETKRMCGLQLERAYTGLQRDSKAVEVALELDRLYPNDPEILYHDGKIYGNFAFLTVQKLARVAPDSIWRHQAEAEAYESQGSNVMAVAEYREVLRLAPRRPGVHYRLGKTLLAQSEQSKSSEDAAEAKKEFEQELQLDPGNANAAYEIGEIDRKAGQFDQAQLFFELAVKYYPDFEQAYLGLAAVLMAQQKPDAAVPDLQKAIALNATDDVSWYRLAQAYGSLGNTAEQGKASAEFQRLRQKSSEEAASRDNLHPSEVTKQQIDSNAAQ